MRILHARLMAVYSGRVDASLGLGDFIVMLRLKDLGGDGSVLIHSLRKGLGARNWMPADSVTEETDYGFHITHSRGETLDIYIEEVYQEMTLQPELEGELIKMGAEREFSDLIAKHLPFLGADLKFVAREARTPAGPVDILCLDGKNPVFIEVKRRRVTPADCWQCLRYLDAARQMEEWKKTKPRGILVAPVLANAAKVLIERQPELSFVRLAYEDLKNL